MLTKTYKSRLILQWTIYTGVMIFLLWFSWQLHILIQIFINDPTKITFLIALFFIGGTIHCGIRANYLSNQLNAIADIEDKIISWESDDSLPSQFLKTITKSLEGQTLNGEQSADNALLADVFADQAHAQHEIGWFFHQFVGETRFIRNGDWLCTHAWTAFYIKVFRHCRCPRHTHIYDCRYGGCAQYNSCWLIG